MRTTLDIPDQLIALAREVSGRKSKRDVVCWALEEATRKEAMRELLARRLKVEFAVTPEEMEACEIDDQNAQRKTGIRRRSGR